MSHGRRLGPEEEKKTSRGRTHQSWKGKVFHHPVGPAPMSSDSQCTWEQNIWWAFWCWFHQPSGIHTYEEDVEQLFHQCIFKYLWPPEKWSLKTAYVKLAKADWGRQVVTQVDTSGHVLLTTIITATADPVTPPMPLTRREQRSSMGWRNKNTTVNLLWTGRHDRTAVLCAEICDGTVQHVDLVEEIHS